MANVQQAKKNLMDKLESLTDSMTDPNETLLAVDTLETLENAISDEDITPSPQFHYRNKRGEFSVWVGHSWSSGGTATIDNYLKEIRFRQYYHHHYEDSGDGRFYGYYAGSFRGGNRAKEYHWFNVQNTIPSSDNCYINGTTACSELGHARLHTGYRALECATDDTLHNARLAEAIKINNAEIDDGDTYFTYDGTILKHKFRHLSPLADPISNYTVTGNGDNAYGTASYNKTRQELVLQNRDVSDSNYNFRISIYKNIPRINRDTKLETVISESNRTQLLYNMTSAYASGDTETWENNKLVLTDDGTIYVLTMNPSASNLYIDKLTRDSNDTTLTFQALANQALYSSVYGKQQTANHGLRIVQSRNKKNVLVFCPYAYYNCGIASYIIDKTRNAYVVGFQQNYTNQGMTPGPFGNTDFVAVRGQNWDAPHDQSIIVMVQKPDGSFVQSDPGSSLDFAAMSTAYPTLVPIIP